MLHYAEEKTMTEHIIKQTSLWFQTNKIKVMDWPAQSSDLNLMENLWKVIKHAVSETKPRKAEKLWNIVQW